MKAALFSRRVAVVASAQTDFREAWTGRQHVDLISEAVAGALRGTGISMSDVDFVIDSGSDILDGRSISNCGFLGAMGAHHKEESRVEEDGLWSALYGVSKIAAGSGRIGLLVGYSKSSEGDLAAFYATQCEPFYQRPVGFDHLAASGIQAQQYLARHGLAEDDLAPAVVRDWTSAAANPKIALDQVPTADDVRGSEIVAAPLRRLEMSRPVDGAVAVLIVAADVARRVSTAPVWITGMGTAIDQHAFSARALDALPACAAAATAAYRSAGLEDPASASLVETGAGSIVGEMMVLESLGLAEPGHAHQLHESGRVAVNPSGGSLPADPVMATGLVRLAEAALQISGQVTYGPDDAQSAIVHGTGGVGMQNHCVFVLEA
jgi:acetyl-CoA C-acetyltransferase